MARRLAAATGTAERRFASADEAPVGQQTTPERDRGRSPEADRSASKPQPRRAPGTSRTSPAPRGVGSTCLTSMSNHLKALRPHIRAVGTAEPEVGKALGEVSGALGRIVTASLQALTDYQRLEHRQVSPDDLLDLDSVGRDAMTAGDRRRAQDQARDQLKQRTARALVDRVVREKATEAARAATATVDALREANNVCDRADLRRNLAGPKGTQPDPQAVEELRRTLRLPGGRKGAEQAVLLLEQSITLNDRESYGLLRAARLDHALDVIEGGEAKLAQSQDRRGTRGSDVAKELDAHRKFVAVCRAYDEQLRETSPVDLARAILTHQQGIFQLVCGVAAADEEITPREEFARRFLSGSPARFDPLEVRGGETGADWLGRWMVRRGPVRLLPLETLPTMPGRVG